MCKVKNFNVNVRDFAYRQARFVKSKKLKNNVKNMSKKGVVVIVQRKNDKRVDMF